MYIYIYIYLFSLMHISSLLGKALNKDTQMSLQRGGPGPIIYIIIYYYY